MPTHRYTQVARRRDEHVHELLISGFTPEQVAEEIGLAIGDVLAGDLRIHNEWNALGPDEAAHRRLLLMYKVIAAQSMQAWQQSLLPREEAEPPADGAPAPPSSGKPKPAPPGELRHLDRALRAVTAEVKLRASYVPQPDPPLPPDDAPPASGVRPNNPSRAAAPSPITPASSFPTPRPKTLPAQPRNIISEVCAHAIGNGSPTPKPK